MFVCVSSLFLFSQWLNVASQCGISYWLTANHHRSTGPNVLPVSVTVVVRIDPDQIPASVVTLVENYSSLTVCTLLPMFATSELRSTSHRAPETYESAWKLRECFSRCRVQSLHS